MERLNSRLPISHVLRRPPCTVASTTARWFSTLDKNELDGEMRQRLASSILLLPFLRRMHCLVGRESRTKQATVDIRQCIGIECRLPLQFSLAIRNDLF